MVTPSSSYDTLIAWELQQPHARRRARDRERRLNRYYRKIENILAGSSGDIIKRGF